MSGISFDELVNSIFGFVLNQFNLFISYMRNVTFLGINIIWWGVIIIIISVVLGLIFRNVGDAGGD